MNMGVIDLVIMGAAVAVFLVPLLIGYFGFGSPGQHRPLLLKLLAGMAGLQLAVLVYFGWLFGTSARHVNHLKWIAPLVFVDLSMWVCFGIGFGVAALGYRIKART
jgi:hypothetical protein